MILENLITDRTQQDADRVKVLAQKAWQDMTGEERAEWLSPLKGSYNYTDMNRVEEVVAYVAGRLQEQGYYAGSLYTRRWSVDDIPNESDFDRYFKNVATLRNAIKASLFTNIIDTTLPKGRMRGDVDGDGKITMDDAVLILRFKAGYGSPDEVQLWCGDVNGDGKADSSDAVAISSFCDGNKTVLTSTPRMADYYGNWTYFKVDDLNGYFYYDIPAANVTADSAVTLSVDSYADGLDDVECMNGVVRVKASRLPLEEVSGHISVLKSTPDAPSSVNDFGISEANALEQILIAVDLILTRIYQAWFYSGDLYSAET